MFRVVLPPIIRSSYNCMYSICYLSHRYCYLPLSWKSWNWFECAVVGVRHPQHTQTGDGWKYHPKHVEHFPDINKLCNFASCWIYIGILLGAHPILHISRIRVNVNGRVKQACRKAAPLTWRTDTWISFLKAAHNVKVTSFFRIYVYLMAQLISFKKPLVSDIFVYEFIIKIYGKVLHNM
jgi:hypothetical protein